MFSKLFRDDNRTIEQIKEHYELEKALAQKLNVSSKDERKYLYTALYNQLFEQILDHPLLTRKADANASANKVDQKMRLVVKYLSSESIFLELGPGDCNLSLEVAKHVEQVYAVDVSTEITKSSNYPENFELIICDGRQIPLPSNIVTVAYSDQLMEHLHPDDALDQLRDIYRLLKPQGVYICMTPNRLSGPHDVSKYFDEVATGFHLKEYTYTELSRLFLDVGFSKIITYIGGKGIYLKFPLSVIKWYENIFNMLPFKWRKKITHTLLFRALLGIIIVAKK